MAYTNNNNNKSVTNPIKNDALEKRRRKERIVESHTEKDYYVCGKKTNKNVWELQQIYETTQAKSTKLLPEFLERIRFLLVKGICKATYSRTCDQNGELFNYVLEIIIDKIVPTVDPKTKKLVTKYKKSKTNLGNYILNTCYWAVRSFNDTESWFEQQVSCGEFMEDYSEVSEKPKTQEIDELKFISEFDENNTFIPLIQKVLRGDKQEDEDSDEERPTLCLC